uniref:Uncharacterized protein n=1 Tax=Siphoviridae sp. ct3q24 TaxID=2827772 RepID=A0A8S5SED8_9CAUD|nr:MAG TPA: hypothetical protein [Siphoviridae sp. ct3q24]
MLSFNFPRNLHQHLNVLLRCIFHCYQQHTNVFKKHMAWLKGECEKVSLVKAFNNFLIITHHGCHTTNYFSIFTLKIRFPLCVIDSFQHILYSYRRKRTHSQSIAYAKGVFVLFFIFPTLLPISK